MAIELLLGLVGIGFLGYALYCLKVGEVTAKGSAARRSERPVDFWISILALVVMGALFAGLGLANAASRLARR